MMGADKFVPIEIDQIPRDTDGNVTLDLYVHLPTANRFVCFVVKGDELSQRKLDALKSHAEPRLFVPAAASSEAPALAAAPPAEVKEGVRIDAMKEEYLKVFKGDKLPTEDFKIEVVSRKSEAELRDIYKGILDPTAGDIGPIADKLQAMSESIIKVVAPEVENVKAHLIRNTKYLRIMNDASAISSLAVLFGLANGFDSQRSYKELAYATLVMDISLSEFDEATLNTYYTNPDSLDPAVYAKIKLHPVKSHQLATEKLKSVTEVTKQLILTHHELHNGKGFPRGIRTDSIFPIARILSLAVDVFHELKKDQLTANKAVTIPEVLETLIAPGIEPHSRRHNTKLVQTTLKFLTSEEGDEAAKS